jgi:hypothetical protein
MSLSLCDYVTDVLCVSLLSHSDINAIIQFLLNTPEHVLVNTRSSCCDALL